MIVQTIAAKWFTKVGPARPKQLIVLHSMEADDKPDTAEAVGRFFAGLPATGKASAHVGVDSDSDVRYVSDNDVAYGAPGANHNGLHLEQTGYARYNAGDWHQDRMVRMLSRAADQCRAWVMQYDIPLRYVDASILSKHDPQNLPREAWGITTHNEVSKAWHETNHSDPGQGYPIEWLMGRIGHPTPSVEEAKGMMQAPCVEIISTPSGAGYWLFGADGGVFAFGDAQFFGSMGGIPLQKPITGAAVTHDGTGYWLVAEDGGVFAFGHAGFFGSMGGKPINGHMVGITPHPSGDGYWLAATDGGVFAFGAAEPHGTPYDLKP